MGADEETARPEPERTGPEQPDGPEPQDRPAGPVGLDARDRAVLALEARSWRTAGAKERAVREELGLSSTRYYQLLNGLLDRPEALAHAPVLVNRLRRVRDARRAAR
ncbi:DUF3263 domain-containing protein [Kitasatospora purpeofusca]|uniref:DUF3263 domain-containing protein n=1 Tax=Kitasatospora purpeofusca TaxID=67352 RepID=UPI00225089F9|nr:DUF3263 domain-containing protein [Kitasatospora purpeofusca]MCX4753635.1 DUF3263 domain-containing protein [Kitasatospora purpeofusca]WSR33124.1 DUF3263 domain-containing protein [Kitasatospora purpeofusca]